MHLLSTLRHMVEGGANTTILVIKAFFFKCHPKRHFELGLVFLGGFDSGGMCLEPSFFHHLKLLRQLSPKIAF